MAGTLLLADDSITIQKVVELTFAETDHRVIAVGSGRDLFRRLPEINPDVVLCDVVMPDMNGYEVCQSLKSDPATLHIPVVLLTGTFEPFDRDRALAAGCDAIVTKPFEARDLINLVEDLLRRAQAVAAMPPPTESVGLREVGVPEGVPSLDYSTTGFDKMVPPPPVEARLPDDGIELTASSLGDSRPKAAPVVPPELQEGAPGHGPHPTVGAYQAPASVPPPPSDELAGGPDHAPAVSAPRVEPAFMAGPEEETHPRRRPIAPERFPVADEEPGFPVEAPPEPAPFTEMAPFAATMPAGVPGEGAGGETPVVSVSDDALFTLPDGSPNLGGDEAPQEHFAARAAERPPAVPLAPEAAVLAAPPVAPAPVGQQVAGPEAASPPAMAGMALSDAEIERVVRRVLEAAPAAVAVTAARPPEFGEEQLELLARRVAELASAKIEHIAWEVIPDMAEMLVRKRIAELEKATEEEN